MLDALFSAPAQGAQSIPQKLTSCLGGCGEQVPYRTNSRVYCQSCKVERKRESSRIAAEKQRRKNGIPKVKGETFLCENCSQSYVVTSKSKPRYCSGCRDDMALLRARIRSFAKDPTGKRKRFKGKALTCVDCSRDFVARRVQVRCDECIQKVSTPHCGETACGDCGVVFPTDSRKKKFCVDCLGERRREASRKCALRRFARRGATPFSI